MAEIIISLLVGGVVFCCISVVCQLLVYIFVLPILHFLSFVLGCVAWISHTLAHISAWIEAQFTR